VQPSADIDSETALGKRKAARFQPSLSKAGASVSSRSFVLSNKPQNVIKQLCCEIEKYTSR
jgi:hypothetical protein